MALARYTYLAWLRRGAANSIVAPATGRSRAEIKVSLALSDGTVTGASIEKSFKLLGPGDIVGVNADEVVRTEPRHWVTDFEPNYFAFIDFYDEDFPWRHTPAPADSATHRLVPWLSLLVLAKGEYDVNSAPGRPLPSVVVKGTNLASFFPPVDQLWAWAHVQVAGDAGGTRNPDLGALRARIDGLPDGSVSRIVSPRRLSPSTSYQAFLVPTFEAGRKAGLGIAFDDETESGTALSWASGASEFPIYYQWTFSTGEGGDFEDLVERIIPRPVDKRVGIRDMDIAVPGFGMPQVAEAVGPGEQPSHHRGVVGLEGALKAPDMEPKPLDPTSDFPQQAAAVVNLPVNAQASGASDPVVAPPLMGGWHALLDRVDPADRPHWPDDLNLDARFRAAGGLGGRVVRLNDERYMKLAWDQVGEIVAANRKAISLRFAQEAMQRSFVRSIVPLPAEAALTLTAPMFARIRGSPQTLRGLLGESRLPDAAMSFAFRKLVRPRGRVARRAFAPGQRPNAAGRLAVALNEGSISAAPPPPAPSGPTLEQIADEASAGQENWLVLARWSWWLVAVAVILVLLSLFLIGGAVGIALAALFGLGAAAMFVWGARARNIRHSIEALQISSLTANQLPNRAPAGFAVADAGAQSGAADPAASARFGEALRDFAEFIEARPAPVPERPRFNLGNAHRKMIAAIAPTTAYPRRAASLIRVGGRSIVDHLADVHPGPGGSAPAAPARPSIRPVMAYPDIKEPMYRPLSELGDDLMTPNLGLIPPNTVTLMLTNPPFIEAYMAGVNHEFARELLWREYPTDSRGSPFRQFWDVSRVMTPGVVDPERARRLKDIRPMHEWPVANGLGTNDNPARGFSGEQVVLALRGDLLKRYPNTIVYAQRARWSSDPAHPNELAVYDEEGAKALAGIDDPNIEYPVFTAPVAPDLTFVGFKLKLDEVRGDPSLDETAQARASLTADKLGWFFVLQEAIGEPRFGLDERAPPATSVSAIKWDNLSWEHVDMSGRSVVDLAAPFVTTPPGSQPSEPLSWSPGAGATAADLAAILYQKPVMVAWHARQMLDKAKLDHA